MKNRWRCICEDGCNFSGDPGIFSAGEKVRRRFEAAAYMQRQVLMNSALFLIFLRGLLSFHIRSSSSTNLRFVLKRSVAYLTHSTLAQYLHTWSREKMSENAKLSQRRTCHRTINRHCLWMIASFDVINCDFCFWYEPVKSAWGKSEIKIG